MLEDDQDSIYITVKNYKSGISKQLHLAKDTVWFVKGPLGFGTKLIPNNLNIIFVGGTGILFILDYLAKFVMYNCNYDVDQKFDIFGKHYKLRLYYTVDSDESALGLEMLRLLEKVSRKFKNKNFILKVRFSNPETVLHPGDTLIEEWDQEYIEQELEPF